MLPRTEKNINLMSSNCWKCTEIVNPTITMLFCIIFKLLWSHQADFFGSWGVACASRTPPPSPPPPPPPLPTGLTYEEVSNGAAKQKIYLPTVFLNCLFCPAGGADSSKGSAVQKMLEKYIELNNKHKTFGCSALNWFSTHFFSL